MKNTEGKEEWATLLTSATLTAFYVSRDRVLGLLDLKHLPASIVTALEGRETFMSTAILSHAVGDYLLQSISTNKVKTLTQLFFDDNLKKGTPFIYDGNITEKGFGANNKTPILSLTKKLDEPLAGKKLVFEFSKDGLVNNTAYTRMSGPTHLFAFGYITEIDDNTIRAAPYIIGDLVEINSTITAPFFPALELNPKEIEQFSGIDENWHPKSEFKHMATVPEKTIKELICHLLEEHSVPKDWGGEESDLFSANLLVNGQRYTGAFLLKGPAQFHIMKPSDLGKNGDQIYRLFNIPAQIYVIQHCHNIGPAVRRQAEAFAFYRSFSSPCKIVFMDGNTTARLLRAHGCWPQKTAKLKKAKQSND